MGLRKNLLTQSPPRTQRSKKKGILDYGFFIFPRGCGPDAGRGRDTSPQLRDADARFRVDFWAVRK
jgi:hypothetical protein